MCIKAFLDFISLFVLNANDKNLASKQGKLEIVHNSLHYLVQTSLELELTEADKRTVVALYKSPSLKGNG